MHKVRKFFKASRAVLNHVWYYLVMAYTHTHVQDSKVRDKNCELHSRVLTKTVPCHFNVQMHKEAWEKCSRTEYGDCEATRLSARKGSISQQVTTVGRTMVQLMEPWRSRDEGGSWVSTIQQYQTWEFREMRVRTKILEPPIHLDPATNYFTPSIEPRGI